MRIVFAGTPIIAAEHLKALLKTTHEIVGVFTQADKFAGRGQKLAISPVKELALSRGISVFQPKDFNGEEIRLQLKKLDADLLIVVAYGIVLPEDVLNIPRHGSWNVHVSLLPRWRGAAPIARAIEAGDKTTGVTVMKMAQKLDAGDIIHVKKCPINPYDTAAVLHDKLTKLGCEALLEALDLLVADKLKFIPQDDDLATYARKLTKEQACINWSLSAEQIVRKILAFNSVPVAFSLFNGQNVRIWEAQVIDDKVNASPGEIIKFSKDGLDVKAADQIVRILKMQLPGKRAMPIADIYNSKKDFFRIGMSFD